MAWPQHITAPGYPASRHVVRYGRNVPDGCVNLCYADIPVITAQNVVSIHPTHRSCMDGDKAYNNYAGGIYNTARPVKFQNVEGGATPSQEGLSYETINTPITVTKEYDTINNTWRLAVSPGRVVVPWIMAPETLGEMHGTHRTWLRWLYGDADYSNSNIANLSSNIAEWGSDWYAKYGPHGEYDFAPNVLLAYTVPEYHWYPYLDRTDPSRPDDLVGFKVVKTREVANVVDKRTLRVKHGYVVNDSSWTDHGRPIIYFNGTEQNDSIINDENCDFDAGIISINTDILEVVVEVVYSYMSQNYIYRGFAAEAYLSSGQYEDKFFFLNLNPERGCYSRLTGSYGGAMDYAAFPTNDVFNSAYGTGTHIDIYAQPSAVYIFDSTTDYPSNILGVWYDITDVSDYGLSDPPAPTHYLRYRLVNVNVGLSPSLGGKYDESSIDNSPGTHYGDASSDWDGTVDNGYYGGGNGKPDTDIGDNPWDLRIARISLVSPISSNDVKVYDSRRHGGGIRDEISNREIWNSVNLKPARNYWDVSNVDGLPYNKAGTILIQVPKTILDEYGGKYTREYVESNLRSVMGIGIVPIIEYI